MRQLLLVIVLAMVVATFPARLSLAQDNPVNTIPRVAVLPWVFAEGNNYNTKSGAIKTAKETVVGLLHDKGFELIDEGKVVGAWNNLSSAAGRRAEYKEIPADRDLLALGQNVGADYVISGTLVWHVKSIWVGLGPKTKASCDVELRVVKVDSGEVDYTAKETSDSTRKEKVWESAGTLLLTPVFTVVSGGPKTPHMQASATNAIGKTMIPWLQKRTTKESNKIK